MAFASEVEAALNHAFDKAQSDLKFNALCERVDLQATGCTAVCAMWKAAPHLLRAERTHRVRIACIYHVNVRNVRKFGTHVLVSCGRAHAIRHRSPFQW